MMEWVTSIGITLLCCISPPYWAVLGSGEDKNEASRPGMFPLCAFVLMFLIEMINHEVDWVPQPDRSNLLIALMRIGMTLSMLWGLRFIMRHRRHDRAAVTWGIAAIILVGVYWVVVATGTFRPLA